MSGDVQGSGAQRSTNCLTDEAQRHFQLLG